jgi:hypothetical protein
VATYYEGQFYGTMREIMGGLFKWILSKNFSVKKLAIVSDTGKIDRKKKLKKIVMILLFR